MELQYSDFLLSLGLVRFPISVSDFLPGIPCLLVVKRVSAQEQRRAPVKGLSGEWQVDSARPHFELSAGQRVLPRLSLLNTVVEEVLRSST